MKPPIIVLTGPTAVGKTALSIHLAKAIGGEIISADSMQVYRHMDIGSAKITREEMEGIPHFLIDVLEPSEEFNVVVFQKMAKQALKDIYKRGHIPIVTGGTGFYIQALLYDIDFNEEDGDTVIRQELEQRAKEEGPEALHRILQDIDPESAKSIHANNSKRVIRAIEYFRQTGEMISVHNRREQEKKSPYRFLYYVINTERELLYQRINERVELMLKQGLVEEVKALISMGCTKDMVSMQGLGYKELLNYLDGTWTLEEAIEILKRDTRHFAKRQLTWFRREKDVRWLNLPEFEYDSDKVLEQILQDAKENGLTGDI